MKNLEDDFYRLSPKNQKLCNKLKHEIETLIVRYGAEVRLGVLPDYVCELFFLDYDCDKKTFLEAMGMSWDKLQGEYQ